jgi:hypothetical protein
VLGIQVIFESITQCNQTITDWQREQEALRGLHRWEEIYGGNIENQLGRRIRVDEIEQNHKQ